MLFTHIQYNAFKERYYLSIMPYKLNVKKTLYVNEESWGFGPGGNETGIIVYELADEVVNEIQKVGTTNFFESNVGFGDYINWQQTPVKLSDAWEGSRIGGEAVLNIQSTKIGNYLDRYAFSIYVDPKIESEIDSAISKSGSYYAYGRTGIIIVIPSNKKVVYAYAG